MGWSCRAEVGNKLDRWRDLCVASTGSANVFWYNGERYFFEVSRVEYKDGSARGKLLKMHPAGNTAYVAGAFKITPTGKLSRRSADPLKILDAGWHYLIGRNRLPYFLLPPTN